MYYRCIFYLLELWSIRSWKSARERLGHLQRSRSDGASSGNKRGDGDEGRNGDEGEHTGTIYVNILKICFGSGIFVESTRSASSVRSRTRTVAVALSLQFCVEETPKLSSLCILNTLMLLDITNIKVTFGYRDNFLLFELDRYWGRRGKNNFQFLRSNVRTC